MKRGDSIYCYCARTVSRFTCTRAPKTVRSTSGATCQTFPPPTIGPALRRWLLRARAISCSSKCGYGPTYRRTPACHGFTIIAKIKPGTEGEIRAYGKRMEDTIAASPQALAPLQFHYLRWVLFNIGQEKFFMYHGISISTSTCTPRTRFSCSQRLG